MPWDVGVYGLFTDLPGLGDILPRLQILLSQLGDATGIQWRGPGCWQYPQSTWQTNPAPNVHSAQAGNPGLPQL